MIEISMLYTTGSMWHLLFILKPVPTLEQSRNIAVYIYIYMTFKIDTKFEGKLTCASKNDMRNLANFHQST